MGTISNRKTAGVWGRGGQEGGTHGWVAQAPERASPAPVDIPGELAEIQALEPAQDGATQQEAGAVRRLWVDQTLLKLPLDRNRGLWTK